jgi:MoaA/NifB/PqqE/SkfB family radical SAM enzyme
MSVKEFAVRQAAKRVLPLVASASERDLEFIFSLWARLAPHEFGKSAAANMAGYCRHSNSYGGLLRRVVQQTSPHVRETMVNGLVIKTHWYGALRRVELKSEGLAVPWTFIMSPTMRCNLSCTGCYSGSYDPGDELEFDVIDRVVREGKNLGIFLVIILGGEPFIRDDMWEVYRRHRDVTFQVYTNGTMIDDCAARKLERLGNVFMVFSVDGFEEDTDARRGTGIFQTVMDGMDRLRRVGVPFGYSAMVTRSNVETIISDEFNDMLIDKGCIICWHFLYMPVGDNPDPGMMPTAEQRELMRRHGAARLRREKPIMAMDFWNDAPQVGGCIAGGRQYLHINARGDVEPCIFVHFAVDNIREKSLRDVLQSPFFKAIRARQPYGDNLLRPCMILDHPHVLRDVIAQCRPYPTHDRADRLLTSLAHTLDRYAADVSSVLDPVWEEEYVSVGPGAGTEGPDKAEKVGATAQAA